MMKARGMYDDHEVTVIAEAGSNHNGDVRLAHELVMVAQKSGADSVKFQFITPACLYVPKFVTADGTSPNEAFTQRSREVLSLPEWESVFQAATSAGISPAASVFDEEGLRRAIELGVPYIKLASTDLTHIPFLRRVAACERPVILSTGMGTLSEIERAVEIFYESGSLDALTLLHCVSLYPCPLAEARLFMIEVLRRTFGVRVGFSDHTQGTAAASIAVAMGAKVIEKHFTTDPSLPGFDHAHAMDPEGLCRFVQAVRDSVSSVSYHPEKVSASERETRLRARRGLYANRDLPQGHRVTEDDVLVVRPSAELAPGDLQWLLGCVLDEPIRQFQPFGRGPTVVGVGHSAAEYARKYWDSEMTEKGMKGPA